tara:strand:+ start:7769 stop:8266 length:498 start_codon:yes stop_codon:yes gene_type:complete
MINQLLSLKKITHDMSSEEEEKIMIHNRNLKSIINKDLRNQFLTTSDGKEFVDLRKYVEHEVHECLKLKDVNVDDIIDKLNSMFEAESVRSKFKFIKCEWCNKLFIDKNGNGKYLLKQHQTRGKNAGKCVYVYLKNKLKTMDFNTALDLKDYIEDLENPSYVSLE